MVQGEDVSFFGWRVGDVQKRRRISVDESFVVRVLHDQGKIPAGVRDDAPRGAVRCELVEEVLQHAVPACGELAI